MRKVLASLILISLSWTLSGQCLAPANYQASNIGRTSIDLDLSGSGKGTFELEYGLEGFTLGSGTTISTSVSNVTLSNLVPASTYRVYLRRVCGSVYSPRSSFNFATTCGSTFSTPVRFNFESPAWQSPTTPSSQGNLDSCWILSPPASQTFWTVGPAHDTRLNTGPLGDHGSGFGKFLILNGESTSLDSLSRLASPAIDLGGLNQPQMELWYHLFGAEIDSLEIQARFSATLNWDTLHTIRGAQHYSPEDPWQSLQLSLAPYHDSIIYLQFVGYGKGTALQMAIDDLSIHDSLDCRPSSNLQVLSNDDRSVLLDWDPGSGTSFTIEYGIKGFPLGGGTQVNASAPPFRINGLNSDTTYTFYLIDNCANGTSSNRSVALEVYTDCFPVTAPYTEDFEGSLWPTGDLEPCWDRFQYHDFQWQVGPPALSYQQSGPGSNHHSAGSSKFLVAHRPNQKGNAYSSLTSPLIDLDTLSNPELVFYTHMFGLQITGFDLAIDSGDGFTRLKRILGSQQIAKSDPWSEQIIDLKAYAGRTIKLKFTAIAASNWSSLARIAIDDLSISNAAPCRKPTNLEANYVGFTHAVFDWQSGGSTDWLYKLKPTGGVITITGTSTKPLSINQLQEGTEYTLWVRDSCGPGLVSDWSTPLIFKTSCLPDSAPYWQDFESPSFVVQSSYFNTGTLDPCWQRSHEIGPLWQPSPATIFPNNLLPSADHTTGTGKYIGGTLFLGNGTNQSTSFTSPHIDLSSLGRPELSFWYFLGGYSWTTNQIQVEINNGSGWQNIKTINGPVQLSTFAGWLQETVDISSYRYDTIQLRFLSLGSNLYAATAGAIDDISIHNNPNCLPPSQLEALSVGIDEASLKWTTGGANHWIVRYKALGGNFSYRSSAVNDSFALRGLNPGTTYEVWVRDSCGSLMSSWHGPIYLTTDCYPLTVPYFEGFDGSLWQSTAGAAGQIDNCWYRSDSIQKVWRPQNGASSSNLSGPSGSRTGSGNYMISEILLSPLSNPGEANEFRSPPIDLSGLPQPELNFWYHLYGSQIQKLLIYVEKSNGNRVLLDSLIGAQQNSAQAPWLQNSSSLNAFVGDTIKLIFSAFSGSSAGQGMLAIDEVEIINAVCSAPQNLAALNIGLNSADLSWSSLSLNSKIEYGLAGFSLGTGTLVDSVNAPYPLGGLQPFTRYEFYVQDSCRNSLSAWAGPFAFTTDCTVPQANFSYQANALSLSFDGSSSSGIALNYTWDFGDGTTAQGISPSHTYSSDGLYQVQLITTDTCGASDTISQSIQVCAPPQAVINYSRNGLTVQFNGRASTGAQQFYWDLGPAGTSTVDSPTVVFPAYGTYSIYLIITNACGQSDTSFLNLLICDKPNASFTVNLSTFNNVMYAQFDGTASTHADSYLWDFGDGSQDSTSLQPLHVYPTPSLNYRVTLIIRANCGLADTLAYPLSGPVSLSELQGSRLAVYPNPAHDHIVLSSKEQALEPAHISWFDNTGRALQLPLIYSEKYRLHYDVSALAPGTYFLLCQGGKGEAIPILIK